MKPVQCYSNDDYNKNQFQPADRKSTCSGIGIDSWGQDPLLGAIVEVRDESWSLNLKNGELKHEFIADPGFKDQWKVIAVDGRFPTDYGRHPTEVHNPEDPEITNDIMMINLNNPNEICFTQRRLVIEIKDKVQIFNPESKYFDPRSLHSDWCYTTEQMKTIIKAKSKNKPIWVWNDDYDEWEMIPTDHPTQFDFADCYYTATKPESYDD